MGTFITNLNENSLIIHEGNTKEISTMLVILCDKILLKIPPWLDNVDLQNNYAIEIMKWVVFEAV